MEIQKTKQQKQIAFVIDIDGTLILSHKEIPGASQAINYLLKESIPFIILTNNVSRNQQTKADQLNTILSLNKPIEGKQVILNYTPVKKYMNWKENIILLIGRQRKMKTLLPFPQIPYYITIQQYCTIFPQSVPLSGRKFDQRAKEVKNQVQTRLNLDNLDKNSLKFGAILVINCPSKWDECFQVIIDCLSSQDGSITKQNQYHYVKNHIPVITSLNDLYFRVQEHNLPRILLKPFNQGLKSVYKAIYHQQLTLITFGKPQAAVYLFTKNYLEQYCGKVKKIVMVGDNEETDILGAYNAGWDSIMTKQGVSKHDSPLATLNCDNIFQGIKQYLSKQ